MWLHSQGYIKKVAACKVKPYKLLERENLKPDKKEETYDHVMLEDGLRDMNLTATKEDLENIATTE